ncbi:hypothetical protein M4578_20215 [Salipiger sp. P9]|nr:hypothetical protein [Salipiger pentaromativorans]MCR8550154.1 hypothetical protein [Salipiger pentaromativorans]
MTENRTRAQGAAPRRDSDDLINLVLAGLWPNDAGLEALLDRIEARGAGR